MKEIRRQTDRDVRSRGLFPTILFWERVRETFEHSTIRLEIV